MQEVYNKLGALQKALDLAEKYKQNKNKFKNKLSSRVGVETFKFI